MPTDEPQRIGARSRRLWLGVAVIGAAAITLVLAMSGCGSSTPGSTVVGETTVVAHGQVGSGPLGGAANTISVAYGKLNKTTVQVPAGTGVVFMNAEDDTKTQYDLVADDGSFDTMTLDPGGQYYVYLAGTGTVKFHDALHPDIKGEIVVVPGDTLLGAGGSLTGPFIDIGKNGFSAATTRARLQDRVTFLNSEDDNTVSHRVVADDGSFDTGVLTPGQSYTVTFTSAGTYSFHDALNPSFKGTITVK